MNRAVFNARPQRLQKGTLMERARVKLGRLIFMKCSLTSESTGEAPQRGQVSGNRAELPFMRTLPSGRRTTRGSTAGTRNSAEMAPGISSFIGWLRASSSAPYNQG
jgi:hypothetical protein